MIREQAIVEWRREAPWAANWMVEQDLVICRALVELFSVPDLADSHAFRGGTALYKLYLPAARYSAMSWCWSRSTTNHSWVGVSGKQTRRNSKRRPTSRTSPLRRVW